MSAAYIVTTYMSVSDTAKFTEYARLAGPAIEGAGGTFLARRTAVAAFEAGRTERTVLIAFGSVELAVAAYNSSAYREALSALGDGAVRDVRVVEGV